MYKLELKDNGLDYLCISVKGFIPLWEECVPLFGFVYQDSYKDFLEAIIGEEIGQDIFKVRIIAKEVRNKVKSLLPCKMSAKELQSIIMNCIEEKD